MLSNKNKYILYLVLLNGLLITVLILWGRTVFEYGRSIAGIAMAMAMFFIYELFVILVMENKSETVTSRQSVNLFLGFKAGKIILSLLFIAVYAILVPLELKRFIGVFLALYFIFLLFDTLYFASREKNNKKKYKMKEIEKLSNYYKE